MSNKSVASKTGGQSFRQFGLAALILIAVHAVLFREALHPDKTVFSNDGPLGVISAQWADIWTSRTGAWQDLNWLGLPGIAALPTVSITLALTTGKLVFSKIYAPFALLFAGLCAWVCFRQFKLAPLACILGAIAVTLNTDSLSTACWGVAGQVIGFGIMYLALAALADMSSRKSWIRVVLGGLAVGMGVMEAFDIGAIFSLFVAAFVVYQALVIEEGPIVKKLAKGAVRLGLVMVFAGLIATAALSTLLSTQVTGVAGMAQDAETKARRWDEATMWSMPKREALGIVVAGLFGYRMDTPDGGNYWGAGGRDPNWDRYFAAGNQGPLPRGFLRYGGGGAYVGIPVTLIALWAIFQSFRKQDSIFPAPQRKLIWFWAGVALFALLMGFGRHAPLYQFFYALPYASTIRNPAKFTHVFEWSWLIVFAYGVHGLSRRYLDATMTAGRDLVSQWKSWWAKSGGFDKKWFVGCLIFLGVSLVGWLMYASMQPKLESYLVEMQRVADLQRNYPHDPVAAGAMAKATASFSLTHVGWFLLFFTLTIGLIGLVLSGYFNGRRAWLGGVLLGVLVVADLGRVAPPWVIIYNYKEKYLEAGDNPVIAFLREKPYKGRVTVWPFPLPQQLSIVQQLYQGEWVQHLFPYNNIQSLDVIMMPRPPVEYVAFETALMYDNTPTNLYRVPRRWQLTNTRYLVGAAGLLNALNTQLDPKHQSFKLIMAFDFYQTKAGGPILTQTNTTGPYALFEYTDALPRAKLFPNWQVSTNDEATLKSLASPDFDPLQTVLVADPISPPAATNSADGTVEFVSYAPKRIALRAKAQSPSVLMLSDKYDPNWKATVNGKPAPLMRCNYIMRGVLLSPGEHTVEFNFATPINALYVSLAAITLALALIGYLAVTCPTKADGRIGIEPKSAVKPR